MARCVDVELLNEVNRKLLDLSEKTGYEILQTNGQRSYGPPPHWTGPPPSKGSEVFVGKLPRTLFEDELVPIFEKVGTIYQIRLMMDFCGLNRGFAFVRLSCPSEAERAIEELNNFEVRPGLTIGVVKSVDNCRLFVGGVPRNKTKEEIMNELCLIVDGITDIILYSNVVDKTKNRGFTFVEFQNHRAAAVARRKLIPGRVKLWGQDIQVDWALPEPQVDEEVMSKVKVLYIRNLMSTTTEETLWKAMESPAGENSLERVKILRDFAFVHFKSREQAKTALNHWNKKNLDGSIVEVKWAKPLDKISVDHLKYMYKGLYPQFKNEISEGTVVPIRYRDTPFTKSSRGYSSFQNLGLGIWGPIIASEIHLPKFTGDQKILQEYRLASKQLVAENILNKLETEDSSAKGSEQNHAVPAGSVTKLDPSAASFITNVLYRSEYTVPYSSHTNQPVAYGVQNIGAGSQLYEAEY